MDIFNQALDQWHGIRPNKNDLIDSKIFNMIKYDIIIIDHIKILISNAINMLNEQNNNSFNNIVIEENQELNRIISKILLKSIINFNIDISQSLYHYQFLKKFDNNFDDLEININNFINLKQDKIQYQLLWTEFIQKVLNIYIEIADDFWNENIFNSDNAVLKRSKIKAVKSKIFQEAKNLFFETYNEILERPNNSSINYYQLIDNNITGFKSITGKIYLY